MNRGSRDALAPTGQERPHEWWTLLQRQTCILNRKPLDSRPWETHSMSSVLKKRRKKMRKHKYKKLRQRQKFLRRKS